MCSITLTLTPFPPKIKVPLGLDRLLCASWKLSHKEKLAVNSFPQCLVWRNAMPILGYCFVHMKMWIYQAVVDFKQVFQYPKHWWSVCSSKALTVIYMYVYLHVWTLCAGMVVSLYAKHLSSMMSCCYSWRWGVVTHHQLCDTNWRLLVLLHS